MVAGSRRGVRVVRRPCWEWEMVFSMEYKLCVTMLDRIVYLVSSALGDEK